MQIPKKKKAMLQQIGTYYDVSNKTVLIASCFLTTTIEVFPTMSYPTITSHDSYLQALEDMDTGVAGAREVVVTAQCDLSVPLGGLYTCSAVSTPTFTVAPLQHGPILLDKSGPSNSPDLYCQVFMGTPISQPIPHDTVTTRVKSPGGTMSMLMPALDTLASGAGPSPSYHHFPLGKKLPKKKALSESTDLSMFDILNTFHHHWFLSGDHLRAQAQKAQKAKDGKIFWVEFSPQFHVHTLLFLVVYPSSFQEGCPLHCYAIYDTKTSLCYKWMLLCYWYGTKAPMAFLDDMGILDQHTLIVVLFESAPV
jgi:hypothetical protein